MHKTRNLFSAKTAQKGSGFLILRCFFVQTAIVFSFSSLIFWKGARRLVIPARKCYTFLQNGCAVVCSICRFYDDIGGL